MRSPVICFLGNVLSEDDARDGLGRIEGIRLQRHSAAGICSGLDPVGDDITGHSPAPRLVYQVSEGIVRVHPLEQLPGAAGALVIFCTGFVESAASRIQTRKGVNRVIAQWVSDGISKHSIDHSSVMVVPRVGVSQSVIHRPARYCSAHGDGAAGGETEGYPGITS